MLKTFRIIIKYRLWIILIITYSLAILYGNLYRLVDRLLRCKLKLKVLDKDDHNKDDHNKDDHNKDDHNKIL